MATSRRRDLRGRPGVADAADGRAARVAALDALARRDRSSGELRRKLIDKGFEPGIVEALLDTLCRERLVDDRRYVENFVSLHAARGHGPMRIRAELRQSGMQGELVDQAVEAYPDWLMQLRKVHQKKFGAQPSAGYAEMQRRARFLSYRGYTGAQIRLGMGFDTELDADT